MTAAVDWRDRASCAGAGDLFFPENGQQVPTIVTRTCAVCPVRGECAADAVGVDRYGIRAGINISVSHARRAWTRLAAIAADHGIHVDVPDNTWVAEADERREVVARLVALGQTNRQIADRLAVTLETVRRHRIKVLAS